MSTRIARNPSELFASVSTERGVAFLDGRFAARRAPYSHVAWEPAASLRIGPREAAAGEDVLHAIDRFVERETALCRTVIGALSYDLGVWIEPAAGPRRSGDLPLVALSSYDVAYTFDHATGRWQRPPPPLPVRNHGEFDVSCPRPLLDPAAYAKRFERLHRWIAAGDVYQANLSIAFDAELQGSAPALYEELAKSSPAPYGAYLDFGDTLLLSNSPELFLERRRDRVTTRPIKGTRPRAAARDEDERLAIELSTDPKERAEHVMIVDLERNDLGRIAEIGSVSVEEIEAIESYATVHHLESTVRARARHDLRLSDFLRALFPGGSITGAPKIRAMQILSELESVERGFYTGAILHCVPGGDFTMSICIRTATVRGGRVRYPAGGGIVIDSRPQTEYAECLLKARAFLAMSRRYGLSA